MTFDDADNGDDLSNQNNWGGMITQDLLGVW